MVEVSDTNLGGRYHGAIEECMTLNVNSWHVPPGCYSPISQIPTFITIEISTAESLVPGGDFAERNMFIGCTAQENGGHGWVVGFKDNQFTNCLVSPESREFTILKGTGGTTDEAAIGILDEMLLEHALVSPRSANPKAGQRSSRYGFYLENKLDDISTAGSSRNARDGNKLTSNDGRHLFFWERSQRP